MSKDTQRLIFVYILKCSEGKYYVGRTTCIARRLFEHWRGEGSQWTRLYPPLSVERVIETHSTYEEGNYVKEYMHIHGIDNVRGGAYVTEILPKDQVELITKEIREAKNLCMTCGSSKHFCSKCPNKVKISSSPTQTVRRGSPKPTQTVRHGSPKPASKPTQPIRHGSPKPAPKLTQPVRHGSPKPTPTPTPTPKPVQSPVETPVRRQVGNRHRSASPTRMVGHAWIPDEEARLLDEYNSGLDIETLSTYHERTQNAIRMKLASLGHDDL